jgi:hypothetical protein
MSRSKRSSHIRRITPVRASRIYAHTYPTMPTYNVPHSKRRTSLQKNKGTRHDREEDSEDTYRSLLRSTHGIEADDNLSPDGTETDTSSNDEGWDEETTLLEMLSIPHSKLFLLRT